jgi:hypothetical protein
VDASPDATWAVVGDVTGVPRWFAKYVACEIDGDIRTLRSAEGAELVERLLEREESERRYAYTVIAGPPLRSHWARKCCRAVPAARWCGRPGRSSSLGR